MLALLLWAPGAVLAHAELRQTTATANGIRMSFDAEIEAAFLTVRGADARGEIPVLARVDPRDPQAVLVAVPGRTVGDQPIALSWRVLSTDGHVTSGDLRAIPLTAPERVDLSPPDLSPGAGAWVAGVGRLLILLGLIGTLGLVVLRWGVVGPAWAQGGLVAPGRPDDAEAFLERARPPLGEAARGWWAGWLAAVAAWAVGVVLLAAGTLWALGAGAGGLGDLLGDTRLGTALIVLSLAWGACLVLGLVLRRRPEGAAPAPPTAWGVAVALPAAAGLWAMSWSGHASSGNDATLNIGADLLHNVATAAWIGGLLGLVLLLVPAGLRLEEGDRVRLVAPGVVRFSALAIGCVAVLAVTGTYRALAELGALSDLLDTAYGRALAVKLALFAILLVAGAYNRLVLHPRLERAALGLSDGERGATAALGRSVRAELLLAAALLVAVAVLLGTAPTA